MSVTQTESFLTQTFELLNILVSESLIQSAPSIWHSSHQWQNLLLLIFFSAAQQFEVLSWNHLGGFEPTVPKHSATGDRYSPVRFYTCCLLVPKFIKVVVCSSFVKKMLLIYSITINISQIAPRHCLKESFLQLLRCHSYCINQKCFSSHGFEPTVPLTYSSEKQNRKHQFTFFSAYLSPIFTLWHLLLTLTLMKSSMVSVLDIFLKRKKSHSSFRFCVQGLSQQQHRYNC